MALINPKLPKQYKNSKVLFEQNLDAWRKKSEESFAIINKNFDQLKKDIFGSSYVFHNNGFFTIGDGYILNGLNSLLGGSFSLSGTKNPTFSINTDAFSATLETSVLTGDRTFVFPDVSGKFLTDSGALTLGGNNIFNGTSQFNGASTFSGDATFTNIISPQLVPIGTIIAFYDFNAGLTFDATHWAYCNGQVKDVGALLAQTLPDMSGRVCVGFGTDGGGDNGSAAWATPAVGNAGNTINIAHQHDMPAHYHGKGTLNIGASGSHSHVVPSDGIGSPSGALKSVTDVIQPLDTTSLSSFSATHTHASGDFNGAVGNTGGSNGDSAVTVTSNLSSTQSIQPISIRVRYLMRIL